MTDESNLHAKLMGETARIRFAELQRFFAAGRVLHVGAAVDLIDAAQAMVRDDAVQIRSWLDAGQVEPLTDEVASAWMSEDAVVWAVVVSPWVLVQAAD